MPHVTGKSVEIAMIGGGLQSFMGPIHRAALAKVGNIKIKCGAFGSTRQTSYDTGSDLDLPMCDVYGAYRDLIRAQRKLPTEERVSFISAVLPNTMHYPIAMLAMDNGIPVLGEKPFTMNLDEAANLVRKQRQTNVPYRIAMVYPAYSQLVYARKMIKAGEIGTIRRFTFSMQAGWMAKRVENAGSRSALWRTDASRNGKGGVVTDNSCHCQFTLEWLTGLEISHVCAWGRPTVPGRLIPDDAAVLVKTKSGISGVFMFSQIATGHREGLAFEITGDKATLRWRQSEPGTLRILTGDGQEKKLVDKTASGVGQALDEPFGKNEAYIEALARIYADFTDAVRGVKKRSRATDDRILGMSIEEGLRSVAVSVAMEKSFLGPDGENAPKWVPVIVPDTAL